jgi:hypothetical protein
MRAAPGDAGNSSELRILPPALAVIFQTDEQVAPRRVAEMAMVAAALPAAVGEFQQHVAVRLRGEDEFLRGADPIRRGAAGAFPAHERGRRQLFDAHLKNGRQLKETEDRHSAGLVLHPHGGRPPRADAVLGGDGLINRFRRRRDADAMDEVGGHDCLFDLKQFDNFRKGLNPLLGHYNGNDYSSKLSDAIIYWL